MLTISADVGFASGTSFGALIGASNSPMVGFGWGPIAFFFDGIVKTFVTNGTAQLFDVAGNLFAGLV